MSTPWHGRWTAKLPAPEFPRAQSQRLEDAPAHCPRCGGIWKLVDNGLQCRTCPAEWLVSERLADCISRPRDDPEAWPTVPHGAKAARKGC